MNVDKEMLYNEAIIRGIKVIDISYITVIYFILGYVVAMLFEKINGRLNKSHIEDMKKKSTIKLLIEICINFAAMGIAGYICRNIAEAIPFPLDGIHGFDHQKVKELHNAAPIFIFIIMFYQLGLKTKMSYVFDRIMLGKDEADKKVNG
jgi:hypothetical protein